MPFAGSGTTQQPSARAGLSSSRYAATDDPLAVLPPRINHSKPPQGEQQATSMAHQSAVWSMTQTTDLPARSSASTKATAQAMTAGNNRANRESAQKQDAAMHAAPTTGPSFEPTAPAQPLTQSETIDHQQARTRGAEPASVSMQLEPSQGIKHPTNVLNPSPAPRADSNQVQDRATPCQGKMPCFGSCGQVSRP